MFSPSIFYWGSLISATLASPLVTTLPCNPNYPAGKPISIGNSQFIGLSDGAKSGSGLIKATTAPFLFSQTTSGTGSPLYSISSFDNPSLVVGLRANGSLFLTPQGSSATQFEISCNTSCGESLVGDGCFVTLASNPKFCIQVGDRNGSAGAQGDALTIRQCVKNDSQRFNFFTIDEPIPPSKPSPPPPQPSQCTPQFPTDEPVDWNNSEAIGFYDDAVQSSTLLIKANTAGIFQFRNATRGGYEITSWDNPSLGVSQRADNKLFLTNKENINARFFIECGECGQFTVGDNCFMHLSDNPKLCVQVGDRKDASGNPTRGAIGDTLHLSECRRDDSQRFNYFRRPKITPRPPQPQPPSSANVCHPNFEFAGVRVANSAVYWGALQFAEDVDLLANTDFNKRMEIRFEQTGSPKPFYVAKSLNGSDLAVGIRRDNGVLFLTKQNASDPYQQFEIDCIRGCPGGNVGGGGLAADGCKIRSAFTTWCVQVGHAQSAGRAGDPIFTNLCADIDAQRFNFLTSPFAPVGRGAGQNGDKTLTVAGAVSDDSDDNDGKLSTLLRNSYIVVGLLGVVLIMLLMLIIIAVAKGAFKGKGKYKSVSKHDY